MYYSVNQLLGIAQKYAPDGPTQNQIANNLREQQAAGATDKEQVISLCHVITDGLLYENWPPTNNVPLPEGLCYYAEPHDRHDVPSTVARTPFTCKGRR